MLSAVTLVTLTFRPLFSLLSRSAQALESEPAASQTPSLSSAQSESTLSSVPSEAPDTFSNLHSSLAPPNICQGLLGSPGSSTEDLSGSPPTMADHKKRALLPPSYPVNGAQSQGDPVREIQNPAYVEDDGSQQTKRTSVPLPVYESLFPKRHGVQGQIRWDNIVAEVNQKYRLSTPELMGPEMSVDGPEEPKPRPRSSTPQKNPATRKKEEIKPVSTKKVAAPLPPKSVSPVPRSFIDSSLKKSLSTSPRSLSRPNSASVPKSDSSTVGTLRDKDKKTPSRAASLSLASVNTTPEDQRKEQVGVNKEAPTAKPRQRLSGVEPTRQEESVGKTDGRPLSSLRVGSADKKDDFAQPDQIPRADLPKGLLGHLDPNKEVKVFGKVQTEQKSEQREPAADDPDAIFNQEGTTDSRSSSDSVKLSQNRKNEDDSKQLSPTFQRRNSQRGKRIFPATSRSENKTFMSEEDPVFKEAISSASAHQVSSTRDIADTSVTTQPQPAGRTEAGAFAGDDPTRAQHFYVSSSLAPPGPLPVVLEEPAPQTEKALLRAWVSPSEVQPVSTQSSNGSVLRRPHPVKPLSPADSQHAATSPAVKDIKVWDTTLGKTKGGGSGPYSQLTQEELISLVVKQQTDLSKKDGKIAELEEYIDNLLVRVIEEKPSILNSLNMAKLV
ncbi:transcript variant X1 [Nothobranchius furzeri]|uniref:Transcript variant X1 n=1 Tax=Nothobranchius furzeri TaxID=105023 RepID=A0A9D2XD53_NOTFU|nr:transcript variant X1 [Nothobranchius furzeri]